MTVVQKVRIASCAWMTAIRMSVILVVLPGVKGVSFRCSLDRRTTVSISEGKVEDVVFHLLYYFL